MSRKAGPVKKGQDRGHARQKKDAELVVLPTPKPDTQRAVPRPPKGLLAATRAAWRTYWRSDVAVIAREVDRIGVVTRLFRLYDKHARAESALWDEDGDFELVVMGSMKQVRINPVLEYLLKLENKILDLETEIGLTPLARAKLGISVGEANEKADQMNQRIKDRAKREALAGGDAEGQVVEEGEFDPA